MMRSVLYLKTCVINATLACLTLLTWQANAHEVWIEPLDYTPTAGSSFIADTRIGENFHGSGQYYIEENTISAGVRSPSETLSIDRISGDIPAMKAALTDNGLHVAWMQTKPDTLRYLKFEKFKKFVTNQGVPELVTQHLERGWPETDFREAFSRYSKSLIQVGPRDNSAGKDSAIGMPIELVAQANPYQLSTGDVLPVQLLWQSQTVADVQVMIFHKTAPKEVAISTVKTNTDGIAVIPLQAGDYMLNAVRMIPWDGEPDALWHSYWASMTFSIAE